jgi:predicted GNAT family acetyltransferase
MTQDIQYIISENDNTIYAISDNQNVGEITYIRVGVDKMIIEHTDIAPEYRNNNIGLNLVRNAANMARRLHRHIITMCPLAQAMFNKYPEFDDIRLMNAH